MSQTKLGLSDLDSADLHRFAEMGRLSASLLHEISNPLSVAMLHLDQVGDQSSVNVKHIRRSLVRLARYVNAARIQLKNETSSRSFNVSSEVSDIKRLVLPVAKFSYVKIKFNNVPKLKLSGDPVQFQQILVNLIINAVEAYPKAAKPDSTRLVLVDFINYPNKLVIKVKDNGNGIDRAELKKVFEPFYTTKAMNGLGLGLVIVKNSVQNSFNGTISLRSDPKRGTCFTIKLPHM